MKSEPSLALSPSAKPNRTPLVNALKNYDQLQRARFHVPAHAGHSLLPIEDLIKNSYRYDLTELDGLDVLSEPFGCIQEAQQAAAEAFGVRNSFFLVNGASVGLQAAMLACLKPSDAVLVPRNIHRSVLSGLILTGAKPIWFLPERLDHWGLWGSVSLEKIKCEVNRQPDIKALVITSPTYEGIGSDIAAIAAYCKEKDILLIVDEAHGSLWPFSEALPVSACNFTCDAVIQSLHKSGGSLTQSALAHLPQGSRIDATVFLQALNTLQTTSPSYLLMASLDATRAFLQSFEGQNRLEKHLNTVLTLRKHFSQNLKVLKLYHPSAQSKQAKLWDPCKFYFRNPVESNEEWGTRLEQAHGLAYESISEEGVLYLANIGLESNDFDFFATLIETEDARLQTLPSSKHSRTLQNHPSLRTELNFNHIPLLPEMIMLPRDAFFTAGQTILTKHAIGRIAKETIVHCPPGIPILMPGERIQSTHISLLPAETILVVK